MPSVRVLVVDDEPMVREMLRECLIEDGWDVLCAGNAADALAAPNCDIAIIDLVLPGHLDGLGLATRLRGRGAAVVLISGDGEALERLARRGQPVLAKPFRLGELLDAVRQVARFRRRSVPERRLILEPAAATPLPG